MHLAIDAVGTRHSGALTVLAGIVEAIAVRDGVRRVTVFCSPGKAGVDRASEGKFDYVVRTREERPWYRLLWPRVSLPRAVRRCGADVLISMSGTGCAPSAVPAAVFIQQALAIAPGYQRDFWRDRMRVGFLRALTSNACRRADLVITQTPEIGRAVAEAFGVPMQKIRSWLPPPPWSVGTARPAGKPGKPERSVLYVGNDSSYKNLPTLLEAMSQLRLRMPLRLVMAGFRSKSHQFPSFVQDRGLIAPSEVKMLYEAADVLVMPSFIETVGLPLIEAMSVGLPVIAADLPYARRVCGGAARYFDPARPESLVEALSALFSDPDQAAQMSVAGIERANELRDAQPYEQLLDAVLALKAEPSVGGRLAPPIPTAR